MRATLNDTYRHCVKQPTNNKFQLNSKEYKIALKIIHQQTVHIQLNKDSKQLCTSPQSIAEAEQTLPRMAGV